jgi:hypothetical protein
MIIREYYYADNNEPVGPLSLDELLERIDRETSVWFAGIEWTMAGEVNELKKFFPSPIINTSSASNKKNEEVNYYYNFEDKPQGPFDLAQLLSKIERDTLVWREGLEWSKANEIDELKKFFPEVVPELKKEEHHIFYYYNKDGKSQGPLNLVELLESIDRETMVWREGIDWTVASELPELVKFFPVIAQKKSEIKLPPLPPPVLSISIDEKHNQNNKLIDIVENLIESKSKKSKQDLPDHMLLKIYMNFKEVSPHMNSLFIAPNINIKKFNKLKNSLGDIDVNHADCLLYFDNTVWGSDLGIIVTKKIFAWHNSLKKPNSLAWTEIERFKMGGSKYEIILISTTKVEYKISITVLSFPQIFVDAFNELRDALN